MKRWLYHLMTVCVCTCLCMPMLAADKSKFDLDHPTGPYAAQLSKTTGGLAGDRTLLTRAISEASMIDGGYFTLGTNAGASSSALDDKCTITYGHPYAKTSYPLVHLDGVWAKPEALFPAQASYPQLAGDSLTLIYTLPGTLELRFVIRMEAQGGGAIHISSSLKNIDTRAHTLGIGLVFDPSLGKGADCVFKLAGTPIVRDTMLMASSIGSQTMTMSERSSAVSGMNIGLSFPSSTPSPFIIGNWNDMYAHDDPSLPQSDARTLYDALIRIFWTTKSVPAQASITEEAVVTVLAPIFGSGVFCRWDVPPTQSVENGIPFPALLSTTFTCSNTTASARTNAVVELTLPTEVQTTAALAQSCPTGAASSAYLSLPFTFKQLFENKVVSLRALYKENGIVIDSLIMPFRICSSPVSDTGLVVTIDSVLTLPQQKMALTFDVQKKNPLQYVFGLDASSIFLYENDKRISDITLGKDTTGGSGSVDIVFVFDVTGSMSNSITGVKNNIIEFTDSLSRRGVDYRLGMVTFLDAVENVFDFTTNPEIFKTNVAAQYAHGGGDIPENSLDALYRATQMSFRPTARKVFIWITDANYHEQDAVTSRVKQDVINRLLSVDVTVHAIGASIYQTDWYSPITAATNGNYYNITGNFRDILLDIGNLHGSSRYMVTYASALAQQSPRDLRLTIHYAGYGGTTTAHYSAPNKAVASVSVSCFPNPFNPQTTIQMEIPVNAHASVVIYNILGQDVKHAMLTERTGKTQLMWNAKNDWGEEVSAGIYFVRVTMLSASGRVIRSDVAKLLYLK